jgi:glyoxylase-like metal-dependent hydrolase (beta-lactamase superfamily II)
MIQRPAWQVDRLENQPWGANTYVFTAPGSLDRLVIDPGEEAVTQLASRPEAAGGRITWALLTHEHYDHISGLPALRKHWNCQVIASRECSVAITNPARNFSRYLIQRDVACAAADRSCEDLDWKLDWGGTPIRFLPTPGHSPGSICIAVAGLLFTGDCLLRNLKRVTGLPGGDKQALAKSLTLLFDSFDPETQVYPGHGEPFRLKDAKRPAFSPAPRGAGPAG